MLDIPAAVGAVPFDLILCRNVFIYFTTQQITSIVKNIIPLLSRDGFFAIGTTESLSGNGLALKYLSNSIYGHSPTVESIALNKAQSQSEQPVSLASRNPGTPARSPEKTIRVLCVDDSPTIHALLKQILTKEAGFEIVGRAMNGQEAQDLAKTLTYDVMTLDIHMPVVNGVEYLQKNMRPDHPPVIVVSSISREESELGIKTLEYGATDYVEKPSMANLSDRTDELRMKIRCAVSVSGQDRKNAHNFAKGLAHELTRKSEVKSQNSSVRLIFAGIADKEKLARLLGSLATPQPPTFVFVSGPDGVISALAKQLAATTQLKIESVDATAMTGRISEDFTKLNNLIFLLPASAADKLLVQMPADRRIVTLIYESTSTKQISLLKSWNKSFVILEESISALHKDETSRRELAHQVIPYSSFLFDSDYILNRENK